MSNESEPRYTLAEAAAKLRAAECAHHGHDWEIVQTMTGPQRIACERCGWSGAVTMDKWRP